MKMYTDYMIKTDKLKIICQIIRYECTCDPEVEG